MSSLDDRPCFGCGRTLTEPEWRGTEDRVPGCDECGYSDTAFGSWRDILASENRMGAMFRAFRIALVREASGQVCYHAGLDRDACVRAEHRKPWCGECLALAGWCPEAFE